MFFDALSLQMEGILAGGIIGLIILMIVLTLVIGAFFLWLALGLVGVPDEQRDFGKVFVTQILNAVIGSFCCILSWYFIKSRHDTSWGKAIAAWFLAWLIPFLIALGVFFAIGGGLAFFA